MPLEKELEVASETLLIQQASGSTGALAALFELHGALVHRVAYRLTLSADEAEDIVQDVFVGLPEALAAYGGRGAFDAWEFRLLEGAGGRCERSVVHVGEHGQPLRGSFPNRAPL
jgi:RNA polymerase sigma-70 factor (ECF subfamily)